MDKRYTLSDKYHNLEKELLCIKTHFHNTATTIHKARNELKIIPFGTLQTVVKSFKAPHFLNKIIYTFFRDSKAKKSYEYSLKLQDFAPEPIGYIEFFQHGLLHESYFISKKFEYDFTIREPLLDKNFPQREVIFQAFARFTLQLHNAGIFHDDYSPGNILIQKNKDEYLFKVVDVNRMGFFKLSQKQRARNFSKLWADNEVLEIIAKEYAKYYDVSEDFTKDVLYYSHKNKKIKNFKKRLKGKPVND